MIKHALYFILLYQFTTASFAAPIVWKIQTNKPETTSLLATEQRMMQQIEQASQGELVFILKSGKGYVGTRQAYNAVRTGEIDAMLMTPSYWGAADPVFGIMGDLVAAWNSPAQYVKWLDKSNGIQYLNRAYDRVGLKLLGYTVAPAESLVSIKPIANVADLNGLVMRAPPGMISDFFQRLGVKTRNIVVHQIVKALQRGRIDMTDLSDLAVNNQAGVYRFAKHTNYPGFHSMPLYDFVARKQSWQKLSLRQQEIVLQAVERWQQLSYKQTQIAQEKARKNVLSQGVTLYRWDKKDLLLARVQAEKVWDSYGKKSDEAYALITELKSWLRAQGNIE